MLLRCMRLIRHVHVVQGLCSSTYLITGVIITLLEWSKWHLKAGEATTSHVIKYTHEIQAAVTNEL